MRGLGKSSLEARWSSSTCFATSPLEHDQVGRTVHALNISDFFEYLRTVDYQSSTNLKFDNLPQHLPSCPLEPDQVGRTFLTFT